MQGTHRRGQVVCEPPAITGHQPDSNPSRAAAYITVCFSDTMEGVVVQVAGVSGF